MKLMHIFLGKHVLNFCKVMDNRITDDLEMVEVKKGLSALFIRFLGIGFFFGFVSAAMIMYALGG
jgi:hypothetical protein